MAKKKGQQKKNLPPVREDPLPPDYSVSSQVSDASMEDVFESYIEGLYERRLSTRIHGLEGIVALLRSNIWHEECIAREHTLTRMLVQCIAKGKGNEPALGARALGLLLITLGMEDGSGRVWEASSEHLLKAACSAKSDTSCTAIEALAIGCFIAEENVSVTVDCMERLRSLWEKGAARVREKAIRAWTLLLSVLPRGASLGEGFGTVGILRALLENDDVGVVSAAGEALTLLHMLEIGYEDDTDESDTMSIESSSTCLSRLSDKDEVMDRMKDLSCARGDNKKKSKRNKAIQKSAFKGYCNFVECGAPHEAKIKLRFGDVLVVDDLCSLIHLNFMRTLLAEGFQVHIQGNELLHQIFNYTPRAGPKERLSQTEKRLWKSPYSRDCKARCMGRGAARSQKICFQSGTDFAE